MIPRTPKSDRLLAPGGHATTSTVIKLVVAGALLGYPIAIYFVAGDLTPSQLLAGLLLLLAVRLLVATWIGGTRRVLSPVLAAVLAAGAAATLTWLPDLALHWLRFYPMLLNLLVFAVFFGSLFSRMPLVERFARMLNPDLPPEGVRYARRVTWAWSGLLLAVALGSLYTAVDASLRVWSLYNGLIVYCVLGGAFACEYLVRTHMRRKWAALA